MFEKTPGALINAALILKVLNSSAFHFVLDRRLPSKSLVERHVFLFAFLKDSGVVHLQMVLLLFDLLRIEASV
jgi:hypothetical protein